MRRSQAEGASSAVGAVTHETQSMARKQARSALLPVLAFVLAACNALTGPSTVNGPMVVTPMLDWLLGQEDFSLRAPILVLDAWEGGNYDNFRAQEGEDLPRNPELGEATPLSGFGALDAPSRDALEAALGSLGPPEFVGSVEEAQDQTAADHLGCLPFRAEGTLITLGTPLQPFVAASDANAKLYTTVAVSRNCSGATWLLELNWDGEAYTAKRIDGYHWAV